jgi:hypothetical protein
MAFYPIPFGHGEWRVDARDPRATRPGGAPFRRPRRGARRRP